MGPIFLFIAIKVSFPFKIIKLTSVRIILLSVLVDSTVLNAISA